MFINLVENQKEKYFKIIGIDRGGGHLSDSFKELYDNKGINRQKICLYSVTKWLRFSGTKQYIVGYGQVNDGAIKFTISFWEIHC